MSDVEFNETINGYRGAIGKLVFRKVKGRTVVSRKVRSSKPPTESQLKQRANMSEAVIFGRFAKADPTLREFYGPIAQQRESSIYQVALQDYLRKASSQLAEPSGDQIKFTTLDDAGLADADLDVKIVAQDGTPIAIGKAVEVGSGSGKWMYTFTQPVATGMVIFIETSRQIPD